MLTKTITYTDYDGFSRTEDFYFNLSKAELMEMELGTTGGLTQKINRLTQKLDGPEIIKLFKDIISMAVCVKSDDGRKLIKSRQISEDFLQTEAYSELFMELVSDPDKASDFMKAILPKVDTPSIPAPPVK